MILCYVCYNIIDEFICFLIYLSMPIHNVLWRARVRHFNTFKSRLQGNLEIGYPFSFLKIIPFLICCIFSSLIHCISFFYTSLHFFCISIYHKSCRSGNCRDAFSAISAIHKSHIKLFW